MDRDSVKDLTARLDYLDERLAYKIRKQTGFSSPTTEQVSGRLDDTVHYLQELKEIVADLVRALDSGD